MNDQPPTPIRPRTDEERKAYVSGYIAASQDAMNLGVEFVQIQAAMLAKMEIDLEGS